MGIMTKAAMSSGGGDNYTYEGSLGGGSSGGYAPAIPTHRKKPALPDPTNKETWKFPGYNDSNGGNEGKGGHGGNSDGNGDNNRQGGGGGSGVRT